MSSREQYREGRDERIEAEAQQYIRRIRNTGKKSYAERYLAWLLISPEEQDRQGEPDYRGLPYMAAQAVRMHLDAITDWRVEPGRSVQKWTS